jgi:D-lactate dehydrogenase (cytochrome)
METFVRGDVIRARTPRGTADALVRITDPERIAPYLADAAHVAGGYADAVVVPRSERAVADVLRQASSVLVIGAQSSLTGGATPRGDTLLSTSAFRSIERLGRDRVRVGAGVTLAMLDEHLASDGAYYPPAPTYTGATIGGTIATNAAGAATFKHGTTRAWVEAITVVLAGGDVLDIERGQALAQPDGCFDLMLSTGLARVPVPSYRMPATPKLSAGYFAAPHMDLIDLFIGAEGTLGVVVEATLRVAAVRPAFCLAFVTLRDRARALALVADLRNAAMTTWQGATGGLDVSAIEHMDARSLALIREDGVPERLGLALDTDAAMALLVTLDLPPHTSGTDVYEAFSGAGTPGPGLDALGTFGILIS